MAVIYKTLFEVKVLHEYYLTATDGTTIFDKVSQQERLDFLMKKFSDDLPSINTDLAFEIPDAIKSVFENYHLKLLNSYSGFKVAIEVAKSSLADGTLVYKPLIPLPQDLNLVIALNKKNNLFDNYTSSRIETNVPSAYYFSNENISGAKSSPSLSNNISPKNAVAKYEQGELADGGAGIIQSFYQNDAGDQWISVSGNGFANENDRLTVPFRFFYSFAKNSGVTQAQFVLKDKDGAIVKDKKGNIPSPVVVNSNTELQKTQIGFDSLDINTVLDKPVSDSLFYTLSVTGNNSYQKDHKIIFWEEDNLKNSWGIVQLKTMVTNAAYNFIDNNGFVFLQKNADGTIKTPPPIFEIRIKSRFPYWRYVNFNKHELNLISVTSTLLDKVTPYLITKTPRNLTHSLTLFPGDTYLPYPDEGEQLNIDNGRLFIDIKVPKSELFPTA